MPSAKCWRLGKTSVDNWSNRDFLIYFAHRWEEKTGKPFHISTEAWPGFLCRIKNFKFQTQLSQRDYKRFIDAVVDELFARHDYTPSFGCIVSEKVLMLLRRNAILTTDFEQLRNDLYKDSALFSQL